MRSVILRSSVPVYRTDTQYKCTFIPVSAYSAFLFSAIVGSRARVARGGGVQCTQCVRRKEGAKLADTSVRAGHSDPSARVGEVFKRTCAAMEAAAGGGGGGGSSSNSSWADRACVTPARILVQRPCVVFWVSLSVALLMTAIPLLAYDMFEIDFTTEQFQVRGNDVANKYNAIELATRSTFDDGYDGDDDDRRRTQEMHGGWCHNFVDVFFQTVDGGDIFTVARIAEANQKQVALQQISGVSRVALSTVTALSGMDASELAAAVDELASANSNNNWVAWDYWTQDCPEWAEPGRLICDPPNGDRHTWADTDAGPSAYFSRNFSTCDPTTSVIRVKAEICTGDGDPASRSDIYDQVAALNDDFGLGTEVRLVWHDRDYNDWQQETQMGKEAIWLAGVMVVVFLLIFVQTRSLFVTSMGFLEVILSFPMGYFVYRVIAGV
eukprot:COSAG02_NODE_13750_length_1354_cov_1.278884_1_plen_438_part_01